MGPRKTRPSPSLLGRREGSKQSTYNSQFTTASEKLFWATIAKDKRFHLKGRNSICSFVDTGVLTGNSRPTEWDCVWPGIAQKAFPLRSQFLRPSVYVLTIFGNENQRGQWLRSGGKKLFLIYNPCFKRGPRILKLTSFIYFALTEHTTIILSSPTSLL